VVAESRETERQGDVTDRTYDEGRRDGQIEALEEIAKDHKVRLDSHSDRLRTLERVIWALTGALAVLQLLPRFLDLVRV
jgi:hypothetical protein